MTLYDNRPTQFFERHHEVPRPSQGGFQERSAHPQEDHPQLDGSGALFVNRSATLSSRGVRSVLSKVRTRSAPA